MAITSRALTSRMNELDQMFDNSLESLVAVYPRYKTNPSFSSYAKPYETSKRSLESVSSEFHTIQGGVRDRIAVLNRSISGMDREIDDLTEENSTLAKRNRTLVGAKNASVGQVESYVSVYRHHVFSIAALVGTGAILVAKMI